MPKSFDDLRPEDLIAMRKKPTEESSVAKYVPVKLSSMGKLGLPAVIHVKDYSYLDAFKLASANTTLEMIRALVEVMDNIIEEDISLDRLTSQDVMEVLMTIQGTWYSPTIEYPYYIDETLPEDKIDNKENISKATIRINSIKTKPLSGDKRVPFTVAIGKEFSAEIDIPRFYDDVIVNQFIEQKYASRDNEMQGIQEKIQSHKETPQEREVYYKYSEERRLDTLKATQAIQILSLNGKPLNTLSERIKALEEFPLKAWRKVSSYIQNELSFGIQSEVAFRCTVTGNMITRRFPFRVLDFIPTMESVDASGDSVSIC